MRLLRTVGILSLLLSLSATSSGEEPTAAPPTFEALLAERDLTRSDLAVDAPPDGLGHPVTSRVPFVLPWIEPFRNDPTRLAVVGGNLLHVAERAVADEAPEAGRVPLLLTALGLQPRYPEAFRGYVPPQSPLPDGPGSLTGVLQRLRNRDHFDPLAVVDHRRPTLSEPLPEPGSEEVRLPPELRPVIAEILAAVLHAGEAVQRSWREVDAEVVSRAVTAEDIPLFLPGGAVFWPALDPAARRGDDRERATGALRLLNAMERLLPTLDSQAWAGFDGARFDTPWGRILLGTVGDDTYVCARDCLLILDPAGNDVYRGTAAAAIYPVQPVALVVDLGGADRYEAGHAGAAQGAGLGGIGILWDAGGDDLYAATDSAQGFGLLGYGILVDGGGNDSYRAAGGAQGSAVFGAGLLVDRAGSDDYRIHGEGQGFGGPGAAGALVDLEGDDVYFAEPDPAVAEGRADYHSENRVAANNAQGAGVGRRGDLTDGHAWAGGVGTLLDLTGDDAYQAGNFAQGLGYWFGTGLLLDGAGDDLFRSVYFSQGSGAHFSLALLYDRSGADRHLLDGEAGASLGYGWDFAASLFLDGGGEKDTYRVRKTAMGSADRSSTAVFVDAGGTDVFQVPEDGPRLRGATDDHPGDYEPGDPLRAAATVKPVGVFLDLESKDSVDDLPAWLADR